MLTRRTFLKLAGSGVLAATALGSYAFGIEPLARLKTTYYKPKLANWPEGLNLRIVALADIHACKPWMRAERIRHIVQEANALKPDMIMLLGDYTTGMNWVSEQVHSHEWAPVLGELEAPLGVYAVMGNHDWWEDRAAQRNGHGPTFGHRALEKAGIKVLENDAIQLKKDKQKFWISGLGDQLAFLPFKKYGRRSWQGVDDMDALLEKVTDDAPVIMMAHEPDIFPKVPNRIALTLSGHTHGGQVQFLGHAPVTTSGQKLNYGHVRDGDKHLIVSGGLGCSIMPVRFGVPPEIVLIETGSEQVA